MSSALLFISVFLISYVVLVIIALFTLEEGEVEMFEGEPRYIFKKEGWYGEDEYWDRKEKKIVVM